MLYHGTTKTESMRNILRHGLKGREKQGRGHLDPMKGRVYFTTDLKYAVIYALGGDFIGHKLNPWFFQKYSRYGYVLEFDPSETSGSVLPDEDSVGEAVAAALRPEPSKYDTEFARAVKADSELMRVLPMYARQYLSDKTRRQVMDGMIAYWAQSGKKLLKYFPDWINQKLISAGAHQSHEQGMKPIRVWRIDRRISHKIERDVSNFFDLAKMVWERPGLNETTDLTETFFSDHIDVLEPIIRGLMQTAARPLIYRLWKRGSKNAVLALAAIKHLRDKGDPNPIETLYRESNLDVPKQFLKRLVWDAGIRDIPGVTAKRKPGLLPHFADNSQRRPTVIRETTTKNGQEVQLVWDFNHKDGMDSHWTLDKLTAYIDGEPVGYLKCSRIEFSETNFSNIVYYFAFNGHRHSVPEGPERPWRNWTTQEKIRFMASDPQLPLWNRYVRDGETGMMEPYQRYGESEPPSFTDEQIDAMMADTVKWIQRRYGKKFKDFKRFHGSPYVDFIRVYKPGDRRREDEKPVTNNWRRQGIGMMLYHEAAKHYAELGMKFYASGIQSDEAKAAWNYMRNKGWVGKDLRGYYIIPEKFGNEIPEEEKTMKVVFHVTRDENVASIRESGLKPSMGGNSVQIGETRPAIHVFYDRESMEDAIVNWSNMDWFGDDEDEDPDLSVVTLDVPVEWVWDDPDFPGTVGLIYRPVPPTMIIDVDDL